MTTCLKYCVPIAAFCFLGALAWQASGVRLSPNDLMLMSPYGSRAEVREHWVVSGEVKSQAAANDSVLPDGDSDAEEGLDPPDDTQVGTRVDPGFRADNSIDELSVGVSSRVKATPDPLNLALDQSLKGGAE